MTDLAKSRHIRKRALRMLCLFLCTAVLLSVCPSAFAPAPTIRAQSTVEELTARKEALIAEQQLLAAQRDETAASLEEQKIQNEIIRKQIEAKSEEIAINQQLLASLDAAIADKTTRIAEQDKLITTLDAEIINQRAALRLQLRGLSQKNGVLSFVQLMLDSHTYTDYLIGFKVSQQISERNEKLMQQLEHNIQTVETARNQAKTDKAALEIERAQAAALQTELENGKSSLQQLYAQSNALADSMLQDVEYLNQQIAAEEAEQATLQASIDYMIEQIRQEEEAAGDADSENEGDNSDGEDGDSSDEGDSSDDEDGNSSDEGDSSDDEDGDSSDEDDGSDGEDSDSSDEDDGSDGEDGDSSDEGDGFDDEDGDSSDGTMLWPAPTCLVITSSFKYRELEEEQSARWHNGLDIACYGDAEGEPIVAAASGKVRVANRYDEWGGGLGYYMTIDHGYDDEGRRIVTVYAHCSEVLVYEGMEVQAGDVIGYVGNTGNSYGAHLHFEVLVDFVAVDPADGYLPLDGIDILG